MYSCTALKTIGWNHVFSRYLCGSGLILFTGGSLCGLTTAASGKDWRLGVSFLQFITFVLSKPGLQLPSVDERSCNTATSIALKPRRWRPQELWNASLFACKRQPATFSLWVSLDHHLESFKSTWTLKPASAERPAVDFHISARNPALSVSAVKSIQFARHWSESTLTRKSLTVPLSFAVGQDKLLVKDEKQVALPNHWKNQVYCILYVLAKRCLKTSLPSFRLNNTSRENLR